MEQLNSTSINVNMKFIESEIGGLTRHFIAMWQDTPGDFPDFPRRYSSPDHKMNNATLQLSIRQISDEMKQQVVDPQRQKNSREGMQKIAANLARQALGFEDRHVDLILENGFFDVAGEFARQAREFDPSISDDDIYQAARNVMTMNFIQLLLEKPVSLTPSIFAYSLLYPLTDNYLDGSDLTAVGKADFCRRFGKRLTGQDILPIDAREQQIWRCIELIEQEFPREDFPLVHASLLGIHQAQVESLQMLGSGHEQSDDEILRLIFAKGGAAVLADGYLVAGSLDEKQRLFMFAYGVFTQLIDDLEDVRQDGRDGIRTLFSFTHDRKQMGAMTSRLFRFGLKAFGTIDSFDGPRVATLKEMIWKCIDPLLIDMASQNPRSFPTGYLRQLEQCFPFSYGGLRRQRRVLTKHNFQLMSLVRAFGKPADVQLGHVLFLETAQKELEPHF